MNGVRKVNENDLRGPKSSKCYVTQVTKYSQRASPKTRKVHRDFHEKQRKKIHAFCLSQNRKDILSNLSSSKCSPTSWELGRSETFPSVSLESRGNSPVASPFRVCSATFFCLFSTSQDNFSTSDLKLAPSSQFVR